MWPHDNPPTIFGRVCHGPFKSQAPPLLDMRRGNQVTDRRDFTETLQSVASLAADIERWCLQMAISGRVSRDRQGDIKAAAQRLDALASRLGE